MRFHVIREFRIDLLDLDREKDIELLRLEVDLLVHFLNRI